MISCCLGVNSFIICFASTSFAGVFRPPCLKDLLLTHASFERVQDQPQDYQDHHDGSPDVQEVELYIFFHIGRIGFHSGNHRRPRREPAVVDCDGNTGMNPFLPMFHWVRIASILSSNGC